MTSDPPTTLITRAANAVYAGDEIDFDALRSELAEAVAAMLATEESAAIIAEHPELADPVQAFDEVVSALESGGPEAAGVLFADVLGRFCGAFGSVVLPRAPFVLQEVQGEGWTVWGAVDLVGAVVEDAQDGHPVDRVAMDELELHIDGLATGRIVSAAACGIPVREAAALRELPKVLEVLRTEGPEAAGARLDELAAACRAGLLDHPL